MATVTGGRTPRRPRGRRRPNERRSARPRAPRSPLDHGDWEPAANRRTRSRCSSEDADRVPELVPLRHGRMLVSAFTFYRGAAAIMAADLAARRTPGCGFRRAATRTCRTSAPTPRPAGTWSSTSTTSTRPCPGPWEWDLKRLAASFEIAGRDRGFDDAQRRDIVLAAARAYREHMRELAGLSNLDVWYRAVDVSQIRDAFATSAGKHERKNSTASRQGPRVRIACAPSRS